MESVYQTIGEKIRVAGVFEGRGFAPKKFEWQSKVYPIQEVTLVNEVKDGGVRQRYYSVMSRGNLYRLIFNREDESWLLDQIWCE